MTTGLKIETGFFPLAFFLHFVTPTIEINGKKYKKEWGLHLFQLTPGDYVVKISFPYIGMSDCGANEIKVSLSEGETRIIIYSMPPWIFAKGSIRVV
ncbi:hypothetical protein C7377_1427 [Balneicella halophila]|uniref:Rhamnogalacturonan lyase domain-containing protein n=1 Tax=Balneicella halophila TaxID=1537566 RepID=A0A7L4UPX8_BALHA|nr:hypothetical protein [Balneicella halophila]PVX51094.1 hypothetical protein C7377_1427 [Balneicella halophila]